MTCYCEPGGLLYKHTSSKDEAPPDPLAKEDEVVGGVRACED